MGMGLFYVTVLVIFFGREVGGGFAGFAVFLRGVLRKVVFLGW
jgi:hypothetical protein